MRRRGLVLATLLPFLLTLMGGFAATTAGAAALPLAPAKVMRIMVAKKPEWVLTTLQGRTLYYFTPDTATKSACTGKCATLWPPLVLKHPVKAFRDPRGVTGKFTTVKDVHGWQIAYNGHLLYTFKLDTKPGQAHGQGFKKVWWIATPGLKPLGGTASTGSGGSSW